jgi:hypothetical protein
MQQCGPFYRRSSGILAQCKLMQRHLWRHEDFNRAERCGLWSWPKESRPQKACCATPGHGLRLQSGNYPSMPLCVLHDSWTKMSIAIHVAEPYHNTCRSVARMRQCHTTNRHSQSWYYAIAKNSQLFLILIEAAIVEDHRVDYTFIDVAASARRIRR